MGFKATLRIAPVGRREQISRRGFVYDVGKVRVYKNNVRTLLMALKPPKLEGPLKVRVIFYREEPKRPKYKLPATRPDIDNYLKSFFDACTGVLFIDDSQIIDLHATKLYSPKPYIELEISEFK